MGEKVKKYSWIIIAFIFIFLYYKTNWISIENSIIKIDHQKELFYDFVHHYYPMGKSIFVFDTITPGYYYTSFFAILIAPICSFAITHSILIWGVLQCILLIIFYSLGSYLLFKKFNQNNDNNYALLCSNNSYLYKKISLSALYIIILITSYPILNNLK